MTRVLATAGILTLLGASAVAQEVRKEMVWKGDAKRGAWVEVTVEVPKTVLVESKEGDILGMKTVGKNVERVYFKRVPLAEEAVVKGHTCSLRVVTVLKHLEFRHFCRVNGAEKPCPGMSEAGECLAVLE